LRLPAIAALPKKWLFFYILWLKIYPYKKFIPLVLRFITKRIKMLSRLYPLPSTQEQLPSTLRLLLCTEEPLNATLFSLPSTEKLLSATLSPLPATERPLKATFPLLLSTKEPLLSTTDALRRLNNQKSYLPLQQKWCSYSKTVINFKLKTSKK
jgi:hypothetical protein